MTFYIFSIQIENLDFDTAEISKFLFDHVQEIKKGSLPHSKRKKEEEEHQKKRNDLKVQSKERELRKKRPKMNLKKVFLECIGSNLIY